MDIPPVVVHNICGGHSDKQNAHDHPEIQAILDRHHKEILAKLGVKDDDHHHHPKLHATTFKTQVVQGTNYTIYFEFNKHEHHVVIFKELPCYGDKEHVTLVA